MIEASGTLQPCSGETDWLAGKVIAYTHPDDVLHDHGLSVAEKRAILAAWASDAHAVPHIPAMRQIDSGAIVNVDTVLVALQALDACKEEIPLNKAERRSLALAKFRITTQ